MKRKLLFLISAAAITLGAIAFTTGSIDKTTVVEYLNSGAEISNTIQNYSAATDEVPAWSLGANMPVPTRYHGCGVTLTRNDTSWLYCLGGDQDGSGTNSSVLSIYNITTNSWSTGAPQPPPTVFYNMTARLGDTIYQMGGLGNGGSFASMVNNVHRYHIGTNTWSAGRNLPNSIADAECEDYQDSLIYIIGGLISGTQVATSQVWLYNRVTGYRAATPMPVIRSGHAAAIVGDTIVVICGGTGYNSGLTNTVYKGIISQSNREVISWAISPATYPGTVRHRFDGDQWGCLGMIMGPGSAPGYVPTLECYRFSPGDNMFTLMPNAPTLTASAFFGSVNTAANIWRWVVASGVVLTPPYSIPFVQVLRDTLCTLVGINGTSNEIPVSYMLYQNYPNPFNPVTTIKYSLMNKSHVTIKIFDLLGRERATLVNENKSSGEYEVNWEASGYPSGVYFYELQAGEYKDRKKMVLIK